MITYVIKLKRCCPSSTQILEFEGAKSAEHAKRLALDTANGKGRWKKRHWTIISVEESEKVT